MAYALRSNPSIEQAIRGIAAEQIDKALAELNDPALDIHTAVHQVRKRCKKIRALLRLVRPQLAGCYGCENAWYRDLARELAWLRDPQSQLDAWRRFAAAGAPRLELGLAARIEAVLQARRDEVADPVRLEASRQLARQRFEEGRQRLADWSLRTDSWDAVSAGLLQTYRSGRKATADAYARANGEHFHDWRKRVKDHGYQLRLLRRLHPRLIDAQRRAAEKLGSLLGEEHDLGQLRDLLSVLGPDTIPAADALLVQQALDDQREVLRRTAQRRGAQVFAEKPKCLRRRMGRYWRGFVHR